MSLMNQKRKVFLSTVISFLIGYIVILEIYTVHYADIIINNKSNLLFSFVMTPILIASVIGMVIHYFFR